MNHSIIRRVRAKRAQRGVVLLEAVIAIVIFGFGVLGLVGLQARSIKESTSARYRTEASLLADELIGKMWVSDRDAPALQAAFASPSGSVYTEWLGAADKPGSVLATLPRAENTPEPEVVITQVAGGPDAPTTSSVSVTLYWQAPYESTQNHYTIVTRIR